MNKVILSGNLTRDPELKVTSNGKSYARFGLAVNRPFAKDAVDFFNVVTWGNTAEFTAKYFSKGRRVVVEGRLQTNSYEKNGGKITAYEVVADNIEFADSKRNDTSTPDDYEDIPPPF